MGRPVIAVVHDYLTQRGGAERVVLSLRRALGEAPIYTSLYEPEGTFPEFRGLDVRPSMLNRFGALRARHRLALPVLAPTFSRLDVPADVAVCSSSGWAHGANVRGRKVVYCHAPARWLYQSDRYLSGRAAAWGLAAARPALVRWDKHAAATAHRYLANSTTIAGAIAQLYGIEAEVVHPPVEIDADGPATPTAGLEAGYLLVVSRLLPYKNVDAIVGAFTGRPTDRLVVVGDGPESRRLQETAAPNVRFMNTVDDAALRWLYANAAALVTASYEDFGLTPIEAAAFGKPTAALRFGGFLDTIVEGETGVFFDRPEPQAISEALDQLVRSRWDAAGIKDHAASFSEARFAARVRAIVDEELVAR